MPGTIWVSKERVEEENVTFESNQKKVFTFY